VVSGPAADFRGSFSGYERDRLFYNANGSFAGFVPAAYVFGLDSDHDGRSVVPVDIDGDGDLDLVVMSAQDLRLYENTSPPKHFARVQLTATRSQHHALGAVVRLRAGGVTRQDFVKITDGFRAQVPLELHFGLGESTGIEALEVRWPSGEVEVWNDLPVDQLLRVRERAPTFDAQPLARWPEGTRPRLSDPPSPTIEARRLDGHREPVGGGRPTVINFWAPWCAPCNVELPQLVKLADRYAGEVDFAGVSVELKDLASVRASIQKFSIPYAQFLADDEVMKRFFGSGDEAVLPSTYVFDQEGRLRRLFRGAITESDLDVLLLSFRDEGLTEADRRVLERLRATQGPPSAR
jgi:thiol-disulfide isomerase/thioredoxin